MSINKKKVCFCIALFFLIIINLFVFFNIKNYFNIINLCFGKNLVVTSKLYVLICVIFCLISILIVLDILLVVYNGKIQNKGLKIKSEDATHGTANWMSEKEIPNVLGINNIPGIILGKCNNNLVKLPFDSYFNKNICVFGSSRKYENNWFFINKFT